MLPTRCQGIRNALYLCMHTDSALLVHLNRERLFVWLGPSASYNTETNNRLICIQQVRNIIIPGERLLIPALVNNVEDQHEHRKYIHDYLSVDTQGVEQSV